MRDLGGVWSRGFRRAIKVQRLLSFVRPSSWSAPGRPPVGSGGASTLGGAGGAAQDPALSPPRPRVPTSATETSRGVPRLGGPLCLQVPPAPARGVGPSRPAPGEGIGPSRRQAWPWPLLRLQTSPCPACTGVSPSYTRGLDSVRRPWGALGARGGVVSPGPQPPAPQRRDLLQPWTARREAPPLCLPAAPPPRFART